MTFEMRAHSFSLLRCLFRSKIGLANEAERMIYKERAERLVQLLPQGAATFQLPSLPGPYPCSSQKPCVWPPSAVQKRGGASLKFVVLGTGPRAAGGLSPYRAPRGSGPLFPKNTTLASVGYSALVTK